MHRDSLMAMSPESERKYFHFPTFSKILFNYTQKVSLRPQLKSQQILLQGSIAYRNVLVSFLRNPGSRTALGLSVPEEETGWYSAAFLTAEQRARTDTGTKVVSDFHFNKNEDPHWRHERVELRCGKSSVVIIITDLKTCTRLQESERH